MTMRCNSAGFSLLEILVAFVILALALGVLMRVFSGAVSNTRMAERYATATMIAESRIAAVGTEHPIREHDLVGEEVDGYRWHIKIQRDEADAGYPEVTPTMGLFRVEVEVSWPADGSSTRLLKLATLRIGSLE